MKKWTTSLRRLIFLAATAAKGVLKTVTGNPIHILDALAKPVQALSVALEPIQDLHGYDNPWPAGGGKNKLPTAGLTFGYPSSTQFSNATLRTFTNGTYVTGLTHNNYYQDRVTGVTVSDNLIKFTTSAGAYGLCIPVAGLTVGSQYTISANCTNGVVGLSFYKEDGTFISGDVSGTSYKTMTVPQETYYTLAVFSAQTADQESVFTDIQLEAGSSKTSYAPYSNICPISGFTGLNVYGTGKNLLPLTLYTGFAYNSNVGTTFTPSLSSTQLTDQGNGVYTIDTTSSWTHYGMIAPIKNVGQTVNINGGFSGSGEQTGYSAYVCDSDFTVLTKWVGNSNPQSFDIRFNLALYPSASYIVLAITNRGTASETLTLSQVQLELGSTASPYEAFVGTTLPVSWQSEAGTVYAGYLSIDKDGNVTLTGTHKEVDGGDLTWVKEVTNYRTFTALANDAFYNISLATIISSSYKSTSNNASSASDDNYVWIRSSGVGTEIAVKDTSKSGLTAAQFQTALSGVQFLYELATPVTYTLSSVTVPSTVQG